MKEVPINEVLVCMNMTQEEKSVGNSSNYALFFAFKMDDGNWYKFEPCSDCSGYKEIPAPLGWCEINMYLTSSEEFEINQKESPNDPQ